MTLAQLIQIIFEELSASGILYLSPGSFSVWSYPSQTTLTTPSASDIQSIHDLENTFRQIASSPTQEDQLWNHPLYRTFVESSVGLTEALGPSQIRSALLHIQQYLQDLKAGADSNFASTDVTGMRIRHRVLKMAGIPPFDVH